MNLFGLELSSRDFASPYLAARIAPLLPGAIVGAAVIQERSGSIAATFDGLSAALEVGMILLLAATFYAIGALVLHVVEFSALVVGLLLAIPLAFLKVKLSDEGSPHDDPVFQDLALVVLSGCGEKRSPLALLQASNEPSRSTASHSEASTMEGGKTLQQLAKDLDKLVQRSSSRLKEIKQEEHWKTLFSAFKVRYSMRNSKQLLFLTIVEGTSAALCLALYHPASSGLAWVSAASWSTAIAFFLLLAVAISMDVLDDHRNEVVAGLINDILSRQSRPLQDSD